MWDVASDRVRVAERIANTENRIGKLRQRVERLKAEGSDATQAEELLVVALKVRSLTFRHISQNCSQDGLVDGARRRRHLA